MPKKKEKNYSKMFKQDEAANGHQSRDRTRMFSTPGFSTPGLLPPLLGQAAKNGAPVSVRATVKL